VSSSTTNSATPSPSGGIHSHHGGSRVASPSTHHVVTQNTSTHSQRSSVGNMVPSPQLAPAAPAAHPAAPTMSPQQQAFLQQQQAAAQAQGLLIVVDPHSRKLRIPLSSITPTRAMSRAGIPSLCLLFLANRCRQGSLCHQVHANAAVVQQLREMVANQPQCCLTHGDINESSVKQHWRQRGITFNIQEVMVPLESIAYTNGLKRFIDESQASLPPAALVNRSSTDDKDKLVHLELHTSSRSEDPPVMTTVPQSPEISAAFSSSTSMTTGATHKVGGCEGTVYQGSPSSMPLVDFAGASVSSLLAASTTSPPTGTTGGAGTTSGGPGCSATEFAQAAGSSGNGFSSSSDVPPQPLVITLPIGSVCRLHGERGGCRFGDDCKFLHVCRDIIHRDLAHAILASSASTADVPASPPNSFQVTAGRSTPAGEVVTASSPIPFATSAATVRSDMSKPASPVHFSSNTSTQNATGTATESLSSSPRQTAASQQPTQLYVQQNNSDGTVSFVPVMISNLVTPQLVPSAPSTVAASPAMLPASIRLGSTPHGSPQLRQANSGGGRPPMMHSHGSSWQQSLSPTMLPQAQSSAHAGSSSSANNFANVSNTWSVQSSPHGSQATRPASLRLDSTSNGKSSLVFSPLHPLQQPPSCVHSPLNLNAAPSGDASPMSVLAGTPVPSSAPNPQHPAVPQHAESISDAMKPQQQQQHHHEEQEEQPAFSSTLSVMQPTPAPALNTTAAGQEARGAVSNLSLAGTFGSNWAAGLGNTSFATNQSFPNFSLALDSVSLGSTMQQHFRTRPSSHTSSCCASPPVAGSPRERAFAKEFAATLPPHASRLPRSEGLGSVEADLIKGLESLLGGES